MSALQIYSFGPGQVRTASNRVIRFRSRKQMALLAYLMVERDQAHSRDTLMALLWGESDINTARNNLRVTLSRLRTLFKAEAPEQHNASGLLKSNRFNVQIHPDATYWFDVAHMQKLLDSVNQHSHTSRSSCVNCQLLLAEAVSLYQNEFLAGFALADCPMFEEWLFVQRERYHLLTLEAYSDLVTFAEHDGNLESALTFAERQIELDPLRELAHRQRIRILAKRGERSLALAAFERCRSVLAEDLGISPEPATLALHERLVRGESIHAAGEQVVIGAASPAASNIEGNVENNTAGDTISDTASDTVPKHNLLQQLTPFIGRERELNQLRERLQRPAYRLLSIVGPGGIGKSRLAQQVGIQHLTDFHDGVYFISLAQVQTIESIPLSIAEALGLSFTAVQESLDEQLFRLIGNKRMLLLLDNFEHLIDGVDLLLALLQKTPNVVLIVTSRERFNVQVEDLFTLRGLPVPNAEVEHSAAARFDSVRLFVDRAHRLDKRFKLTPQQLPHVVRICQIVEGLPLGIELAATWIRELSCREIADELEDSLSLLQTTLRDVAPQHRGLDVVFDSSWSLLSDAEQRVLVALSIFRGSFSFEAAKQVASASTLLIAQLCYKSLLRHAGSRRYDMHEMVRQFSALHLTAQPQEHKDTQRRHSAFFLRFVHERMARLNGPNPQSAQIEIQLELDNIRAAWQTALDQSASGENVGDCIDGLSKATPGLAQFYLTAGLLREGATRFGQALKQLSHLLDYSDPAAVGIDQLRLHLLLAHGHFQITLAQLDEGIASLQQALALAHTLGDAYGQSQSYLLWGYALKQKGESSRCCSYLQQALDLARQVGDIAQEGKALRYLGVVLDDLGQHEQAREMLQRALVIQQAQQNLNEEQTAALYLGVQAAGLSEYQMSTYYFSLALDRVQRVNNRSLEARIQNATGFTTAALGDLDAALPYHERSRAIAHEIGEVIQESHALHNLCTVERKRGNLTIAETYGREALRLAEGGVLSETAAYAWLHLGYVWGEQQKHAQALEAFHRSHALWLKQKRQSFAIEALAGVAEMSFHTGDRAAAARHLEQLLPTLASGPLEGVDEPFHIYLSCCRLLIATHDHRAESFLAEAQAQLLQLSNRIDDRALRLRFLHDIPAHRALMQLEVHPPVG